MKTIIISFPNLIYNCESSSYSLTPLPDSIILEGIIFAHKSERMPEGILAVGLNLKENIDDNNYYKSIERLKNLICLAYSSMPQEIKSDKEYASLQEAVKDNIVDNSYNPKVRFGGQLDWDLPLRVAAYSSKLNKLNKKDQIKFWQALQTFSYARLIAHLPNPQYKYTLYMTLHLASINQLADNPQNIHNPLVNLICPKCKVELSIAHQTSHGEEIEKLIKTLIPVEYQEQDIEFMRKLYHPIRSRFIHEGKLVGKEELGGFIGLWKDEEIMIKLAEPDINLMIFNRTMLEQFLEKKSN